MEAVQSFLADGFAGAAILARLQGGLLVEAWDLVVVHSIRYGHAAIAC